MNQGASGAALRDVNRSALLNLLVQHGPLSRAELARRLGVRAGTVTALVRGLAASGLVAAVGSADGDAPAQLGRPAELVGLLGRAAVAIGIKVADDHLAVVRAELDGTVLDSTTAPFDPRHPFDGLTEAIAAHVEANRGAAHSPLLLGIGLGLPGYEDPYGSGVVNAPLLGWRHVPIAEHLQRVFELPVLVDNDVNTLAVAEHLYGVGRGLSDFLTVTIGRGVGMGIVLGGQLYRGAGGAAGEFGHVRAVDDGDACMCGKHGCLETVVADAGLLAEARRRGVVGARQGMGALLDKAQRTNREARAVFADAARALGRAVAAAAVVLDPQAIVVGGEGTRAWELFREPFCETVLADRFPSAARLRIEQVAWDDDRWALGAASLVLRAPFVTPLHDHPGIDAIRRRLDAGFQAPLVREAEGSWSA